MGINFVMVFSPNTFAGAPHAWLATLTDRQTPRRPTKRAMLNAVTRAFPAVTTVRVKDALDVVNRLVGQLGTAIRAAASVALIASVLVLAGALAAGNRARIHDAVVLKTLGATRRTLIAAFSLEYMLIGLATAIFALFAGGVAAWFVVARIMTLPSSFLPEVAVATIVAGAGVDRRHSGLLGTWRVLGHKAAPVLQESLTLRRGLARQRVGSASDRRRKIRSRHGDCSALQVLSSPLKKHHIPRRHAGVPPAAPGRRMRPTPDGTEATEEIHG